MVTRLTAPNPSPLTLEGTNGYIIAVGPGALVAVDPGIDDRRHIDAFVEAARAAEARYAAILVTHGHPDHYPGALALRRETGAPVLAHPGAQFAFDRALDDGELLRFPDAVIRVLHAPGHAADHLVFWLEAERALFTGDVVIGRGTVVIAPPGGDMRRYQVTLERLLREFGDAAVIYGGHGPPIDTPRNALEAYIAHRREREAQIVTLLQRAPATIPAIVRELYAAVSERLWPAAARQVLAYLIALENEGRVRATPLEREPTAGEAALLDPDLRALASEAEAPLLQAELGLGARGGALLLYALAGARP